MTALDYTEMLAKLPSLKEATNAVLEDIIRQKPRLQDAVNWADLSCRETMLIIADDGDARLAVSIEECSPDANKLRQAVWDGLEAAGWKDIEVDLEW